MMVLKSYEFLLTMIQHALKDLSFHPNYCFKGFFIVAWDDLLGFVCVGNISLAFKSLFGGSTCFLQGAPAKDHVK